MKLQRDLIFVKPDNPRWRYDLCVSLLDTSDHKAVQEAVRDWENKLNGDKAALQEAAWFLSRCVPLAGDKGLADNYAADAVRLLKKAAEDGFREPAFLKKKEFDVLRMRTDFADVARLMQIKK
jgi:hypothetical protein